MKVVPYHNTPHQGLHKVVHFVKGYIVKLYRIQTYWNCDRYEILIESRTALYSIGTINSCKSDFWYGTILYRIKAYCKWYIIVLY
jgi:hypothetical protein